MINELESVQIGDIQMKECTRCYKKYDNTWAICLECGTPLKETDNPRNDELSMESLIKIFDKDFPSCFLPGEDFYSNWAPTDERLNLMAQQILKWLKLKNYPVPAKYADKKIKAPGVYVCNNEGAIYVSEKHRRDPFQVGAILAHECMHHYMKIRHIEASETKKNELKTDLATICAGLGILIINGMSHKSQWYVTVIALFLGRIYINEQKRSFGYYSPEQFGQLLNRYLKLKFLSGADVIGYLHPAARSFLPKEISGQKAVAKSNTIQTLEKKHKNAFIVQLIVVVVAMSCILSFYYAGNKERQQDGTKIASEFRTMKQKVTDLENNLKNSQASLQQMKRDMDYYETTNDTKKYGDALLKYEDLKTQIQKDYSVYQGQVKLYNYKVEDLKYKNRS